MDDRPRNPPETGDRPRDGACLVHDPSDMAMGMFARFLPRGALPYIALARLDRPIGWWLLLLPGWWGILLAGHLYGVVWPETARLMALFMIGAIVMRGAGCVVNDLWDMRFDAAVARTRHRPLASGAISRRRALIFLFCLALIGAGILSALPFAAIITGLCSLPLIILYPLAKRIMPAPQFVLAPIFSWGALLGFAAQSGEVIPPAAALLLYGAAACWVFGYDTIYAVQDMEDDRRLRLGSSALWLGAGIKPVVAAAYMMMLVLLVLTGRIADAGNGWFIGLGAVAFHFTWQIKSLEVLTPKGAGRLFRSNRDCGLLVALAAALAGLRELPF